LTECTQPARELQLKFDLGLGKPVVGSFDGGQISSDGGLILLRQADKRLRVTEHMSLCIADKRRPDLIEHSMEALLQQRLLAIASGYEDANDAGHLRSDPMHKLCAGSSPLGRHLASQPTLSRLENSLRQEELDFLQDLLVHTYLRKHKKPPRKLVLDLDTTCDPVHGYQQMSFFNGFYGTYCYVPMFVFTKEGFPLAALLRPGNADVGGDAARVLRRIFTIIRKVWPRVPIEFRADAAFCRREVYEVCEKNNVTYYIGLRSNHALRCLAKDLIQEAKTDFEKLYGPATMPDKTAWRQKEERMRFSSKAEGRMQESVEATHFVRKVGQISWRGRGYTEDMKVICRADYSDEGPELRFVITNRKKGNPRWLYEDRYCGRCQCENWIKELKSIACDRLSCQEFAANQFRLMEHTFAYILLLEVRERLSKICGSISVEQVIQKFIRIGVLVTESVRRVTLKWSSTYPWKRQFSQLYTELEL
jgi:hypothetical protein